MQVALGESVEGMKCTMQTDKRQRVDNSLNLNGEHRNLCCIVLYYYNSTSSRRQLHCSIPADHDSYGIPVPSNTGYGSSDTDEEEDDDDSDEGRSKQHPTSWCTCGQCPSMSTDQQCYCCQESDLLVNSVTKEGDICVTDNELFRDFILRQEALELSSYDATRKPLPQNPDGIIKTAGLRHVAYRSFLNLCKLRGLGKGRRFVLPACVVGKIRDTFPDPTGNYVDFQEGEYSSRV